MSAESRVEVLKLQRATILVRLCAVYVEYERHRPVLRVRSKGNLHSPVFRLTVDVFGVFELLAAPACSYGASSTTKFLEYRLMVLLIL